MEADGVGLAVRRAEDHLRPARGEVTPTIRCARLQEDRPALRRARDGERAARAYPAPFVIRIAHLGRVDEDAAFAIHQEGVWVPAFPKGDAGFKHLVGAVVALVLGRDAVHPEITRFKIGRRGHHVPRRAPACQHIERGQRACQVVRLHEGGGECRAKTQMLRHPRHDRQDHQRVEIGDLPAIAQISVEIATMDVGQAESVSVEAGIEAGGFQHARDVLVTFRREDVVQIRLGVPPGAGMVRRGPGLEVGYQMHAPGHRAVS